MPRSSNPADAAAALTRLAGRNITYRQHSVRMMNKAWCMRGRLPYKRLMFWVPLLLLAWAVAGVTCLRLCLAAVRGAALADSGPDAGAGRDLTLYEAAFLSGGPARVADVTLVAMARQRRLLLAHTGWATVVDPHGRDEVERSVIGAIGPQGQSPSRRCGPPPRPRTPCAG
ncbi:hypothetical protein SHKM778_28970 [Streptomyces sp. KM77-8]|uniref:TIGR04222 domain-containing membrane protein n=1 Tax=Streptomyces haneummycinicus TaxID=3074435 RepID=A0AAT9HGV1_9ACTN